MLKFVIYLNIIIFDLQLEDMATYESLITLKGSVGNLVFYSLNGKNVVRKKSGFNKTAFKKSPSYEKVRQNSSEFGHCSKVGKIIRQSLDKYIKESGDPLLYQKFAKLMTEIKDLDLISERGNRTVENGLHTEKGKLLLKAFQFGKKNNLDDAVLISLSQSDKGIHLNVKENADQIVLVTLKINFDDYSIEQKEEQKYFGQQKEIVFDKHFSEDNRVLYFIALCKEEEIVKMGFI
ncbi:hypothetical protein M2347_003409 [Chryseobacterium sp. H1D6B]|uniref:hypothetical protein n=1 Tax=Chryseobacterium sp. H1D6B TaxID=2940588 RepID=UPI0017F2018E|nr:hypothetical protein [Chryseobacterium sp. H1D6B]MDH6253682.1 hypothetical protein [Chryseobacterium sp. H1D6B]